MLESLADKPEVNLEEVLAGLSRLCTAVLELGSDFESLDIPVGLAQPSPPVLQELQAVDRYRVIFDPYEEGPSVEGSLIDDLGDIYGDVKLGLLVYEQRGSHAAERAAAFWRFTFDTHWGRHAWSASAALHAAIQSHQFE
jgi:hypothetical protein